jgi:hypothetical protein
VAARAGARLLIMRDYSADELLNAYAFGSDSPVSQWHRPGRGQQCSKCRRLILEPQCQTDMVSVWHVQCPGNNSQSTIKSTLQSATILTNSNYSDPSKSAMQVESKVRKSQRQYAAEQKRQAKAQKRASKKAAKPSV